VTIAASSPSKAARQSWRTAALSSGVTRAAGHVTCDAPATSLTRKLLRRLTSAKLTAVISGAKSLTRGKLVE
jgi:hypothetical protein